MAMVIWKIHVGSQHSLKLPRMRSVVNSVFLFFLMGYRLLFRCRRTRMKILKHTNIVHS